jgi:hypothetical protein
MSKERTRVSSDFVWWGGLAAIVAGVMYILRGIVSLFDPQKPMFTSFSDYLIEVMFVVALLGTLGAIAGLHVLHQDRYGRLGVAGSLTAFVGTALLLVAAVVTALAGREAFGTVFLIGFLVTLVGLVLLGVAVLHARVLPSWCGVLLIAGFPLSAILDVLANVGGELLGVVWTLVGYALLSNGGASTRQPTRVS